MAALDWSQCPAVESIPGKVGGAWVFRNTRLPVDTVIENLEDLGVEEVMEQFHVTREQISATLDFVAQSLKVQNQGGPLPPSMLILFDDGTPKGLARSLPGHTIVTAQSRGWDKLDKGALMNAAEEAGLSLLLTTDRRIRYQQNLAGRTNRDPYGRAARTTGRHRSIRLSSAAAGGGQCGRNNHPPRRDSARRIGEQSASAASSRTPLR
jgi:uncharacterized protein (DUF433 family)